MSEEMVQHQQATWYRCYQSHSDWRRHDRCIGLVAFWNCYCSKGTQHSLCTMFLDLHAVPPNKPKKLFGCKLSSFSLISNMVNLQVEWHVEIHVHLYLLSKGRWNLVSCVSFTGSPTKLHVHVFCWKFSSFLLHQTPCRNFVNLVSVPKKAGMFCL